MKKIFLTGGSGLLGNFILMKKKKQYEFYCSQNKKKINKKNVKTFDFDLSKKKNFKKLKKLKIDAILHCAGITNVDLCEKNTKKSYKANFLSTKNLVDFCRSKKIRLIYISSDHIFTGKKSFHKETSQVYGVNVYARHKILSENYIKKKLVKYLIIRTNFIGKSNGIKDTFNEFVVNSLKEKKEIRLWKDVYFTPTSMEFLIKCIFYFLKNEKNGTINVSGSKRLSKFEFGVKLAKKHKFDIEMIKKVKFDKKKFVRRPLDMSLSNHKLKKSINFKIPTLNQIINKI